MDFTKFYAAIAGLENGAELQAFIQGELSELRTECANRRVKNSDLVTALAILGIQDGDDVKGKLTQVKGSLDAIAEKGGDPKDVGGQISALTQSVADLTKKLDDAEKRAATEKEQRIEEVKRNKVQEALTKGNVINPAIAALVLPSVKTREDGSFAVVHEGQELSFDEGITKWLAANSWAISNTQTPGSGGSGNTGSGEVNPWKKDSFNLTKQGEIYTKDPELAKRMMAEAQGK